jgi:hypothetical protein
VTRPELDKQYERAQAGGVLVDGFVAPVGDRDGYHSLFSGKNASTSTTLSIGPTQ